MELNSPHDAPFTLIVAEPSTSEYSCPACMGALVVSVKAPEPTVRQTKDWFCRQPEFEETDAVEYTVVSPVASSVTSKLATVSGGVVASWLRLFAPT